MSEKVIGDRCPTCNGAKTVVVEHIAGFVAEVDCDKCAGTGVINSPNACKDCQGNGKVLADVTLAGFGIQTRCQHCNGSGLEPLIAG